MANEHEYIHEDGTVYMTGCLPPKYPEAVPPYASVKQAYTMEQIKEKIKLGLGSLFAWVFVILNQSSHPWCWEFSATQCLMVLLNMLGYEKVILDPTVGNLVTGVMGGNAIDAMITEVQSKYGQPTAALSGNDPVGGSVSPNRIPANWKEEAAKRTVPDMEWYRLNSYEELATALLDGNPCCVGLSWQGGGHALACLEVGFDENGDMYFAGPNSWALTFKSGWGSYPGRPGWWKLKTKNISGIFDGYAFGAYALCGAKDSAVA